MNTILQVKPYTARIFGMLTNIIEWFNAYPSRIYALVMYVIMFAYVELIIYIRIKTTNRKDEKRNKRFVFCDGAKRKVLYVDMVTQYEFDNYSCYVGYGIIDRNATSIYFDASRN